MGQYCIYAHCTITHQGKCYIFLKLKLWNTQEIKCGSRIFYIQKMNVCLENFNLDSCVHQLEMWFSIFSFPQMITTFFWNFFHFLVPCLTQLVGKILRVIQMYFEILATDICCFRIQDAHPIPNLTGLLNNIQWHWPLNKSNHTFCVN